jgi:hypothetical protein
MAGTSAPGPSDLDFLAGNSTVCLSLIISQAPASAWLLTVWNGTSEPIIDQTGSRELAPVRSGVRHTRDSTAAWVMAYSVTTELTKCSRGLRLSA